LPNQLSILKICPPPKKKKLQAITWIRRQSGAVRRPRNDDQSQIRDTEWTAAAAPAFSANHMVDININMSKINTKKTPKRRRN